MEKLVNVEMSPTLDKLAVAMNKVQAHLRKAEKSADNPYFKSKYADLESCWDAARDPLVDNGLSVIQIPLSTDGERITVRTMLLHISGQYVAGDLTLKPVKSTPQDAGSAITYGRRYGLSSFVGIIQTDDDGNAASGRDKKPDDQKIKAKSPPAKSGDTIYIGSDDQVGGLMEYLDKNRIPVQFQDEIHRRLLNQPITRLPSLAKEYLQKQA